MSILPIFLYLAKSFTAKVVKSEGSKRDGNKLFNWLLQYNSNWLDGILAGIGNIAATKSIHICILQYQRWIWRQWMITQAWLGIWSMSHVFRCFMYTNSQLLGKYFYKYMPKMKKHIPFNVRPSYIIEITFTQEMRVIYNYIYCVLYIYAYYFTR